LYILPLFAYSDTALVRINQIARERNLAVVTCSPNGVGRRRYIFQNNGEVRQWDLPLWPFDRSTQIPSFDFGPARLHLVPLDALAHPEMAAAAAKQGGDMALALEEELSPEHRLLAGARTIENIAVAVCACNGAGIWITPEGHQRWEETFAAPGEICSYPLDTQRTRMKRFQDCIDFEVLFRERTEVSD
jgi:hypothetical protein